MTTPSNLRIQIQVLMEGLKTLKDGKAELESLAAAAKEAGAAQATAAQGSEAMMSQLTGFKALKEGVTSLAGLAAAAKEAGLGQLEAAKGASGLSAQLGGLKADIPAAKKDLESLATSAIDAGEAQADAAKGSGALLSQLESLKGIQAGIQTLIALAAASHEVGSAQLAASKGILELTSKVSGLSAALPGADKGMDDLADSSRSTGKAQSEAAKGAADMLEQVKALRESVATLEGGLKGAVKGFLAFAGLGQIKDMADLAARNETLSVVLETVGFNAGYSAKELDTYEQALKKQGITTSVARDTMVQFIKAGIDMSTVSANGKTNIENLAEAAQNLAVVTGGSSSEALSQMVLNIQQMDSEGLRFLGVNVEMEKAMSDYADSVNKAAGSLSEGEKKQAVINAILKEGEGLAGVYSKSMETVGKQLGSMKRLQEEAAASIGSLLIPAYSELVKLASSFLKVVEAGAEKMKEQGAAAAVLQSIAKAIGDMAKSVGSLIADSLSMLWEAVGPALTQLQSAFSALDMESGFESLRELVLSLAKGLASLITIVGDSAESIAALWTVFGELASSIGTALKWIYTFTTELFNAKSGTSAFKLVLESLGLLFAGLADGISILTSTAQIGFGAIRAMGGDILMMLGKVVGFIDADLGRAITNFGRQVFRSGLAAQEAGKNTLEAFANGESAVSRFSQKLDKSTKGTEDNATATEKQAAIYKVYAEHLNKSVTDLDAVEKKQALLSVQMVDGKLKVMESAEAYKMISDKINAFNGEVRKGTLAGEEAKTRSAALSAELKDLAESYNFSKDGVKLLTSALTSNTNKAVEVGEHYKTLGLGAREFATHMSDAGGQANTAFTKIVAGGVQAADALRLLSTALNMETSIAGVGRFQTSLIDLYTKGLISSDTFLAGMEKVNSKFFELTESALKAAKTKEDFAALEEDLRKSGISGEALAIALEKVATAARNASADSLQAARDVREMAQSESAVLAAKGDLLRANLQVSASERDVTKAQAAVYADNNELNRAKLALAEANLALSKDQAALSKATLDAEIASHSILIAQQKEQIALKAQLLNPGDVDVQKQVDAATKLVEIRKTEAEVAGTNVQLAAQQVELQQQQVDKAGAVVDALNEQTTASEANMQPVDAYTQRLADRAAAMAESSKQASEAATTFANAIGGIMEDITNSAASLKDMGATAEYAEGVMSKAQDTMYSFTMTIDGLLTNLSRAGSLVSDAMDTVREQNDIAETLKDTMAKAREEAQGLYEAGREAYVSWGSVAVVSEKLEEAIRSARSEARGLIKDLSSSVTSFLGSADSIRMELLDATGEESKALAMRYDARRKELTLEYEMLRLKGQAAIITARAAGLSLGEIAKITTLMEDASKTYQQATRDLNQLESIEQTKLQEKKRTEQSESRKEPTREPTREPAPARRTPVQNTPTPPERQALSSTPLSRSTDSQAGSPLSSTTPTTPSKKVTVNFGSGLNPVSGVFDDKDVTGLVSMLENGRTT